MKKITLSLGIVAFAVATFFRINSSNTNSDVNLAHLIAINSAQALADGTQGCEYDMYDLCFSSYMIITDCGPSWSNDCQE